MSLVNVAHEMNEDHLEVDLRNRIQDTVRSYRHFWDPLSELLQNSVDSINRRHCIYNVPSHYLYDQYHSAFEIDIEPNYKGEILIEFWKDDKRIRISDNGTGIAAEKIERILLPEGSDKVRGKEYGYKGKGLTYSAFVSQKFKLITKFFTQEVTHEIAYDSLFDWLVDQNTEFPVGPIPDVSVSNEGINGFNTCIDIQFDEDYEIKFPSVNSLDYMFSILDNYKENTYGTKYYKGLEVLLRTKTAVGNTKYLFNEDPIVDININVIVYDDSGDNQFEVPYRYYHPKENIIFSNRSYSFSDYLTKCQRVGFDKSFRCLFWHFTDVAIGSRLPITANIHHSALSSNLLNDVNSSLGFNKEGLTAAAINYGVHLSIDGMPTGIRIDNWDKRGSANKRFFALADVELKISDELDSGRKGISATRAIQISDYVHDKKLMRLTLPAGTESDTFGSYASKYLDWGQSAEFDFDETDFEQRTNEAFDVISKDNANRQQLLSKITNLTSLLHIPTNEEEVRALFHELLARNIVKGYRTLYAAASRATYDAGFIYNLALSDENLYPNDTNGFSRTYKEDLARRGRNVISQSNLARLLQLNYDALCVEYKYSIGAFIEEINKPSSTSKQPRDLNLLIAWSSDVDDRYEGTYTWAEIDGDMRILHSTTHKLGIITPENTDVYCIVLEQIFESL